MKRFLILFGIIFMTMGVYAPFVVAEFDGGSQGFYNNPQGYSGKTNSYQSSAPNFGSFYGTSGGDYWPILSNLEKDQCDAVASDFIIGIPPGGCQPMVVRSDLLAEQNVPVFCQLSALRINPLIKVSSIKSISFKGEYPEEVAGISFHPARAAVNSYSTLLGDPVAENIGYVVIVLKRQIDEDKIPEYVFGNLTATIRYDMEKAYGTGKAEYYLEPMAGIDWGKEFNQYAFWGGKGYVRAVDVTRAGAKIEILTDKDEVYRTLNLERGQTSGTIHFPGSYCTVGMKVRLNSIENSEPMAFLSIDDEDNLWVRQGTKILDGKCTVTAVSVYGGGSGEVNVVCPGTKFSLQIKDARAKFSDGKSYQVGDKVGGKTLGYYKEGYAVLFDGTFSEMDATEVAGVLSDVEDASKVKEKLKTLIKKGLQSGIVCVNANADTTCSIAYQGRDKDTNVVSNVVLKGNLTKGNEAVESLIEKFGSEKKGSGDYYGEEALFQQILLVKRANDEGMLKSLTTQFISEYPSSDYAENVREIARLIGDYNYDNAYYSVLVNNAYHDLGVVYFEPRVEYDDFVRVMFNDGAVKKLNVSDENFPGLDKWNVRVLDIDANGAKFMVDDTQDKESSKNQFIKVGETKKINGLEISVVDTEVYEVAHVSILPEVRDTKTEANFTFKVGIENRAIEITPEKAKQKIDALNKTIADWNERLEKLGNVVSGLKGACFATSSVLMIKSMISGVSGESLARKKVMEDYKNICAGKSAEYEGDMNKCYMAHSEEIEDAVEAYAGGVDGVNSIVERVESSSDCVKGGIFGSSVINEKCYVNELKDKLGSFDYTMKIGGESVLLDEDNLQTTSQVQAAMLWEEMRCTSVDLDGDIAKDGKVAACRSARRELDGVLMTTAVGELGNKERAMISNEFGIPSEGVHIGRNVQRVSLIMATVKITTNFPSDVTEKIVINKGEYYSVVKTEKRGAFLAKYVPKEKGEGEYKIYNSIGDSVGSIPGYSLKVQQESDCTNPYVDPKVIYYEAGEAKNLPAVIPIDLDDGYYAYVSDVGDGILGSKGSYEASGAVNSFYICNVGKDGRMNNGPKSGADLCQSFNVNNPTFSIFAPCSNEDSAGVKRLYEKALGLIREAARSKGSIVVDNRRVERGDPMAVTGGLECTDFMSPKDCNTMFNVCDPVICPSSRCDLGGKNPVSDVIASGIIGSLTLCLPNAGNPLSEEGGVLIPICLSGVHAGIDSYVSILESYQSCLQERVDTGAYTGICDEITSVYMCEFFWRQASPLLDTLIPSLLNFGGSKTKGGAEYLTTQAAFDNAQESASYYTDEYAAGAFRAFQVKNTEELGGEVCNGFVGTSLPTGADAIESLLEPESPVQFNAYFSSTSFTDATVPSTAHYNVFYHIYAGNDQGAQYRIYLKNPPESGYYATRPIVSVKTGFINRGEQATESLDFTAPEGYKELCVDINGREECGFGKVSSSFAVNYASAKYVEDQAAQKGITTEKDCMSGTYSEWGLLNLNVQQGLEDAAGPADVSSAGVTRVCASLNPTAGQPGAGNTITCMNADDCKQYGGTTCDKASVKDNQLGTCKDANGNQVVSQSNWVDVGYCGESSLRCWLDESSVKDTLKIIEAVEGTTALEAVRYGENLEGLERSYQKVSEELGRLAGEIKRLNPMDSEAVNVIIGDLDEIAGEGKFVGEGTNADKAYALALKASVYRMIVEQIMEDNPDSIGKGAPVSGVVVAGVDGNGGSDGGDSKGDGDNIQVRLKGAVPEELKNLLSFDSFKDESVGKDLYYYSIDNSDYIIGLRTPVIAEGVVGVLAENINGKYIKHLKKGGFSAALKNIVVNDQTFSIYLDRESPSGLPLIPISDSIFYQMVNDNILDNWNAVYDIRGSDLFLELDKENLEDEGVIEYIVDRDSNKVFGGVSTAVIYTIEIHDK